MTTRREEMPVGHGTATRRGRPLDGDEARDMGRRGIIRQRAKKLLDLYMAKPLVFPKKELMGFEEAARLLNWSRQSVYHAATKTKEIPYVQVGSRYYIRTADLAKFFQQMIQEALEEEDREAAEETTD